MNADGSAQTRLTNNAAYDSDPQWSPDSQKIAFMSSRDGTEEVYVMNADGSMQTRLTKTRLMTATRSGHRTAKGSRSCLAATPTPAAKSTS